jgi:hypothetical protein
MLQKICSKCGLEKELDDFVKNNRSKSGYSCVCSTCNNERSKKYRKNNSQKCLKLTRDWCHKHPEWVYNRYKKYRLENPEKINENHKNFYKNNPEKRKEYRKNYKPRKRERRKERQKDDPVYKITNNVRGRMYKYLKKLNITKRNRTFEIVGMSPSDLKEYLEKQFTDGMNWENHGQFGWHIDHRMPLDSAKTEDELYKLCHYTNLQPLWWLDNIHKSTKII